MAARGAFLLGVLVDWTPPGDPCAGWPEHTYAHLSEFAQEHDTLFFLFTPLDVHWAKGSVRGWRRFPGEDRWERRLFALPDAVYNRIGRRRVEAGARCRLMLQRLGGGRPLFNPRFLQKWEVHQALAASSAARYAPWATLAEEPRHIIAALNDVSDIFVKPVDGSLGRGVTRITRRGRRFDFVRNRGTITRPEEGRLTQDQLARAIPGWLQGHQALIQAAVPLATWNDRPFDTRVLMQRDTQGDWRLTGAAGRVALPDQLTTHTHRGGTRLPLDRLEREADASLPDLRELEEIGRVAALAVEEGVGRRFFEFSMDIGITRAGQPFILEINAKPFPFDENAIRRRAAHRLFEFARAAARGAHLLRPFSDTGTHHG